MWFRNLHRRILAALGLACLMPFGALADDSSSDGSTNPPAAFRTLIKREEIPDAPSAQPIVRAYFSSGTNQFAFAVPGDFKLDASVPGKIILTSPDFSGFIAVQLVSSASSEAGIVMDSFRNLALSEFPGGTIVGEFQLWAANHSGPAFELSWKNYSGAKQQACIGFVQSRAGLLKFSLLSNSETFPVNQMNFRCLLRSFQSNERGKLEILQVSGAS